MGNAHAGSTGRRDSGDVSDFEHQFEGELQAATDPQLMVIPFSAADEGRRPVTLRFDGDGIHLLASVGTSIGSMREVEVLRWAYAAVTQLGWDHSQSWLRLTGAPHAGEYAPPAGSEAGAADQDAHVVLKVPNSLELEEEMRLRFGSHLPAMSYMGVFAGRSKPKPFERRRASLSVQTQDRLPSLKAMRHWCQNARNEFSAKPMRKALALQHIHEGQNHFAVADSARTRTLVLDADSVRLFDGTSARGAPVLEVMWSELQSWSMHHDMGLEVTPAPPARPHMFCVEKQQLAALRHTVEFFWNQRREAEQLSPQRGSTHGRRVKKVHTLIGEQAPPDSPMRSCAVSGCSSRRASGRSLGQWGREGYCEAHADQFAGTGRAGAEPEHAHARSAAWGKLVRHQGTLLKRGRLGNKWTAHHAVLYRTSQGHYLAYYKSAADLPTATSRMREKVFIDLSSVTSIRPTSSDSSVPSGAFDIVTINQTWTLRAETEGAEQLWLQVLSRAVDEDVAIAPDERLEFSVKPLHDPTHTLPLFEYSTTLSFGMAGCSVLVNGQAEQHWYYTDFYKWSVTHSDGKKAVFIAAFADTQFDTTNHFVFRTREAEAITTCIEYYIEKFIAVMQVAFPFEAATHHYQPYGPGASHEGEDGAEFTDEDEELDAETRPETFTRVHTAESELAIDHSLEDAMARSRNEEPDELPHIPARADSSDDESEEQEFDSDDEDVQQRQGAVGDLLGLELEGAPPAAHPRVAAALSGEFLPNSPRNRPGASAGEAPPQFDLLSEAAPLARSGSVTDAGADAQVAETDLRADPAVRAAAAALLFTPSGVLLDGPLLRVDLQSEFRGSQGRLSLLLTSKHDRALRHLAIELLNADGLRSQASLAGASLEPRQSLQGQVMLEVMRPFDVAPAARLRFETAADGQWHALVLPLPVLAPCFAQPVAMPAAQFLDRWQQIGADANLPPQQIIVTVAAPVGPATLPEVAQMLRAAVIAGADPGPGAVGAAAVMQTGSSAEAGGKLAVGYLLRIEVAASAFRVSVRATHKTVAISVAAAARAMLLSRYGH